jgi:hypothetical protein
MKKRVSLTMCLGLAVAIGCSRETSETSTRSVATSAVDGSRFLLSEEPHGAEDVIQLRETSRDGDDVLIVGRIGGGEHPWVEGRAAFTIVDGSLKACSDIPGDECAKPWDYCCQTDQLPTSTALVKIVDESGQLVKTDARELLQVTELSTVVAKGKAQRDDSGNLTVLARGVYVKQK